MARRRGRSWDWGGPEVVGIVLVAAGAYWLLAETGWFFWLGWNLVWPLVLVGLGALVIVQSTGTSHGSVTVSVPRDDVTQLELNVGMGGGRLTLTGGSGGLVDAESTLHDVTSEIRRNGTAARVRLRQDRVRRGRWWGGTEWRVRAASDVPTDLRLTAGAGEFTIDLSSITVVRASLSIGAASARVTLPHPRGEVEVAISTGAASVALTIPSGVEARVANAGGLISVDGRTETPGYGTATDRVSVRVTGGASSITVHQGA